MQNDTNSEIQTIIATHANNNSATIMRENLSFSEENNQQLEENRNYRFTCNNIIHIVRNLFNPTFLHVFCPLNERKITLILTAMTSVLNIVITILPLLSIPDYFYTNLFIISLFNCILINARNISLFKRAYKHVYFFNCSIVVQNYYFIFCFSYWYLINFYVTDLAFEIIFANGILIFSCRIFFSKTKKQSLFLLFYVFVNIGLFFVLIFFCVKSSLNYFFFLFVMLNLYFDFISLIIHDAPYFFSNSTYFISLFYVLNATLKVNLIQKSILRRYKY